jgi:hypothetical protein
MRVRGLSGENFLAQKQGTGQKRVAFRYFILLIFFEKTGILY